MTKRAKKTKKQRLTPNQKIFADEWLIDRNGTRAYKIAYRSVKKETTAQVNASRLLLNAKVNQYITGRLEKISEKAEINQEWVLDKYKKLACYNITDFFNDDGTMKLLSEIPEDAMFAIQGLEVDTRTIGDDIKSLIQKFKLPDKRGTVDSIAKLLGLVVDKKHIDVDMTHELSDGLKAVLGAVYKRKEVQ